jgi:putative ABC transport system permease protein
MVNAAFAEANGFVVGDVFHANINGQRRALTITGTALSPEFIYTIGPGALMPDNEGYGILWMTEASVAAAFDMEGAFNHLALRISAEAVPEDVMDALDVLLDPYGGLGAYDRSSQVSDSFVSAEIDQLQGMAVVVPPIFFAIAAFLVGMVISRIVALDRAEIGLLKALGYSDIEVSIHYLLLAALIAVVGVAIGWSLGTILARLMAWQYARFFDFPYLIFRVPIWVYAMSGLIALLTTMLGALRAALMAARLAPAVAMQPPAPPMFRRGLLDRADDRHAHAPDDDHDPAQRHPLAGAQFPDRRRAGRGHVVDHRSGVHGLLAQLHHRPGLQPVLPAGRHDPLRPGRAATALPEVARLPGVIQVEPQQFHSATLRNGPREKRVALEARPADATLSRVIGEDGSAITAPPGGILLSTRLAEHLELQVGDSVEVAFMTGLRETHEMAVTGLVEQYLGLGAYADIDVSRRAVPPLGQMSVVNVLIDEAELPALHAALQETPALSGLILMTENRRAFEETISQNIVVINGIYAAIAIMITVGVAYNGARIQLSERARELASLRILGFSRAEVSSVLVGETMLLAILAQPLGWLFGIWIATALSNSFTSDLYAIPLVLEPAIFAQASLDRAGRQSCLGPSGAAAHRQHGPCRRDENEGVISMVWTTRTIGLSLAAGPLSAGWPMWPSARTRCRWTW